MVALDRDSWMGLYVLDASRFESTISQRFLVEETKWPNSEFYTQRTQFLWKTHRGTSLLSVTESTFYQGNKKTVSGQVVYYALDILINRHPVYK